MQNKKRSQRFSSIIFFDMVEMGIFKNSHPDSFRKEAGSSEEETWRTGLLRIEHISYEMGSALKYLLKYL